MRDRHQGTPRSDARYAIVSWQSCDSFEHTSKEKALNSAHTDIQAHRRRVDLAEVHELLVLPGRQVEPPLPRPHAVLHAPPQPRDGLHGEGMQNIMRAQLTQKAHLLHHHMLQRTRRLLCPCLQLADGSSGAISSSRPTRHRPRTRLHNY